VTDVKNTIFHSGFRLHPGGPFPTSRSLETRPSADALRNTAMSSEEESRIEGAAGPARIGGPTAFLLTRSDIEPLAPDLSSVTKAYREAGES
jgi:hypothetical protein